MLASARIVAIAQTPDPHKELTTMNRQIYINLPVADVPRTLAFWKALGFSHHPQFTGDDAACIVISEEIYHMALSHEKWRTFTTKAICDTAKAAEVSLCLSCESRAKVDELIAKAVEAGGSKEPAPTDHGVMYLQGFDDPDGHHWELVHMGEMRP
jgi:predicted lactoylglutathione lyase